ncbi:MAG: DsbA family oxidoreductase [Halobacteriales archaeon]|nr:DsbA family oxidoreductase [Halobacteriales archaeon]
MTDEEAITVYSDYVCPFCYLGRESLERYRESTERELELDWHPFDLRAQKRKPNGEIDHTVDDGKDETYYEEARKNVERLSEKYEVKMLGLDELPENIDSFDAQAVSLYVKEKHPEHWETFDEAVFDALWVDGRDIGDAGVLADIADDVGLDADEIRDALEDEELRKSLRRRFLNAQEDGITGVPTFVHGEHFCRGAVPPEQLRRLVEG